MHICNFVLVLQKTTKPKRVREPLAVCQPDNNANSIVLSGVHYPRTSTPIMSVDMESESENYIAAQSLLDI